MALEVGSRLGPFEIVSALGAGGMGEVYRARDGKLNRDVALKILPDAFASDPDRLARFRREAQVLASLNHPHIAAIYGFEDSGSTHALVLELVEGPTLVDRIALGPIPLKEALPIAKQTADALDAAHEQGIVHRDLKPANVKLRPDGTVKVLDFGLAKALEPAASGASVSVTASPTLTSPALMTGMGTILGTAAYMSPEQAKGRPADKRSDVWAFGCVLYEMLTSRRPFEGDDVPHTLAFVLTREPDWTLLPSSVPLSIRRLLRRCLQKDRAKRLADIADVRWELDEANSSDDVAAAPTSPKRSTRVWQVASLLLMVFAAAVLVRLMAARGTPPVTARFVVSPPEDSYFTTATRPGTTVALAPDGRTLAFTVYSSNARSGLWTRRIDAVDPQPIAGTSDARVPFWSPDSQFIVYSTARTLMKVAANGGPTQKLCDCVANRGGAWSTNGTIVFARTQGIQSGQLFRIPSAGGTPVPLLKDAEGLREFTSPAFLPDGRHVLFHATDLSGSAGSVYVASIDAGMPARVVEADSGALFDASSGHLLFVRQGTLLAQPFDATRLVSTGEPFPVAERVEFNAYPGVIGFSVSTAGVLAYGISTSLAPQSVWVDRRGKTVALGPQGSIVGVDLSPDGKRIASHRHEGPGGDIWLTDIARGTTSRFTFDASQDNSGPVWSGDGRQVAFGSLRAGKWGLYVKAVDATSAETLLVEPGAPTAPMSWSRDGQALIYWVNDPKTAGDLWMIPMSGDRKPVPIVRTPFGEGHGAISPDGKWLAYESNESGRREVYVQQFPGGAGKLQISTSGGALPRWRSDGRELFYVQDYGGKLFAIDVTVRGSTLEAGTERELFEPGLYGASHLVNWIEYAVTADGQRFLMSHAPPAAGKDAGEPIEVVLNWTASLKK